MGLSNEELRIETMQQAEWPYSSYGVRVTHVATCVSSECSLFLTQSKNLEHAKHVVERMVKYLRQSGASTL